MVLLKTQLFLDQCHSRSKHHLQSNHRLSAQNVENTFRDLSLETAIALEMMVGVIVTLIEKELSFQQDQDKPQRENSAMDIV